jgi:hypothetical protein
MKDGLSRAAQVKGDVSPPPYRHAHVARPWVNTTLGPSPPQGHRPDTLAPLFRERVFFWADDNYGRLASAANASTQKHGGRSGDKGKSLSGHHHWMTNVDSVGWFLQLAGSTPPTVS